MFDFEKKIVKITLLVLSLIYIVTLWTSIGGYGYPGANGNYSSRSFFYFNNADYYPAENVNGYRREGGGPQEGK